MSWQNDGWGQDDTINSGYPYREDAGNAASFDGSDCCTIWNLSGDYPMVKSVGSASTFDPSTAASPWKFSPQINFGYPYLKSVYKYIQVSYPRVDIPRPLMVYAPETRDFFANGFACLNPTAAEWLPVFGEAGEITVVHPVDTRGVWRVLQPNVIILAPTEYHGVMKPQAFRIYRVVKSMDNAGKKTVTAYARHVFYDLNYSIVSSLSLYNYPIECINAVFSNQMGFTPGETPYFYNLASDAWVSRDMTQKNYSSHGASSGRKQLKFEKSTIVEALIGDGSIMQAWGLELYVDNFYFSLYSHEANVNVGNVWDNAFTVRYSHDMTGVTEDLDYTSAFTHMFTSDNFGSSYAISVAEETYGTFVRPTVVSFSYSNSAGGAQDNLNRLEEDASNYWNSSSKPTVCYTASYAPLNKQKALDFIGQFDGRDVGDTGTIVNTDLGISTTQRIISKRVDLLTGITLGIKLGNPPAYITQSGAWKNTVKQGAPSATDKQIEALRNA